MQYGFSIQAVDLQTLQSIVWFDIPYDSGIRICREVWPGEDFLMAPGGSSAIVEAASQAEAIDRILGSCHIGFDPRRHRWLFHMHLV